MVEMSHAPGCRSTAEGVESTEQLAVLREIGVDAFQGRLFARPLPPEEFRTLLRRAGVAERGGRMTDAGQDARRSGTGSATVQAHSASRSKQSPRRACDSGEQSAQDPSVHSRAPSGCAISAPWQCASPAAHSGQLAVVA